MKKWLLVTLVLLPGWLFAQEPLTLEDAIQRGLKNNFDIQIQKNLVEIARNNNNPGQAGRYPTINLLLSSTNNLVSRVPANPFAVPGTSLSNSLPGQVDIGWVIFNGFSVSVNKDQLERLQQQSEGNASIVVQNTLQSIILAYSAVLLEKERLEVRKKLLELSRTRYDQVRLKKNVGSAITFDVLQEESNFLTDSGNYVLQSLNYRNAVRNLNVLINERVDKTYSFPQPLRFTPPTFVYSELEEKMTRSNFTLKNQFITQEILRGNTQLAKAPLYPSFNVNLGATGSLDWLRANFRPTVPSATSVPVKNTVGYLLDDPAQPVINTTYQPEARTVEGNSYGTYANFTLRWTLFNGGQIKRSVQNARTRELIGQQTTDQLKLTLQRDLQIAYDLFEQRKQIVEITRTNQRATELNLSLAEERYRVGYINAIDLRLIQLNYQNATLANLEAIYNLIDVYTDLMSLTGSIIDQAESFTNK
ncbi:MAG: TolC family protein [Cyclobacteriaceae bacterium]|nr:TolC family protein [Cyclobacteriaceae bacterium]